jgi:hypothetical protein
MNYQISSSGSRSTLTFIFHFCLGLLLCFFIAFFIFEIISFLKLFEVKTVINPTLNLLE